MTETYPNHKGFPYVEYYVEYKELGGTHSINKYFEHYEVFIEETLDIFVGGDTIKHESREEAMEAVQKKLKISDEELYTLFHSIDNVTSYT
jgi:hypothetical protein